MGIVESLYLKITGENAKTIVALQDGFDNTSYQVNSNKVFRLKKLSEPLFYNAENEGKILNLVGLNRLNPKLYYFDYSTGNMIDRFINGNHRFCGPAISESDLKAMANVLRRLHSIKNCKSEFYAEQRFSSYKIRSGNDLRDPYEKIVREFVAPLIRNEPLVLCHNDLVHDNILKNKDTGQIVLIDFEFAGLNNAFFDLASLLGSNQIFDEKKWGMLLSSYFGKGASEGKMKKLVLFMAYENYLWYYWGLCRYQETKHTSFKDAAEMRKNAISFFADFFKKHSEYFEK